MPASGGNEMATGQMSSLMGYIRRVALPREGGEMADGQLLECFLAGRDERAFEALLRRHGPMVLGVCRQVLGNEHDAEDAFQATFLVLVRKANSIVPRDTVASWLYGVAYRTALKAKGLSAKRRQKERRVKEMSSPAVDDPEAWDEVRPVLDQEVQRLPEKYRLPVVLCDLEGKTRKDAARQVGWPEGTLSGRLSRARVLLARRLTRRGVTLSAASLAVLVSQKAALACLPPALVVTTVKTAALYGPGQPAAVGLISAKVAALSEGVLKAMIMTKLKVAAVLLLAAGVLGTGAGALTHHARAGKPGASRQNPKAEASKETLEVSGFIKNVDAAQGTITIHGGKSFAGDRTYALAKDAKVFLDDGTGDKFGFEEGKLADLTAGLFLTLRLSPEEKVVRIWVEGVTVQGILKAADAANHTVTVAVNVGKGESAEDKSFAVASNARIQIDDAKPKDKSKAKEQEPGLGDLPLGALVTLKLSAGRKGAGGGVLAAVGSIRAEGQKVSGVVKAVDAGRSTITLGDKEGEKTFAVDKDAAVFIDEGNWDKSSSKTHKLADVPNGAVVTLRLSLDQKSVVAIQAEGAVVDGTAKAVDAAKDTITLGTKQGDRTFTASKNARVFIDEKSEQRKLGDVPAGADVRLKLLADQKTVGTIWAAGPTVHGVVKGGTDNNSLTVADKLGEQNFSVPKEARILIDDRKQGKLAELIEGTVVRVRLSADKSSVLEIHAEGPSFQGLVKVVDPKENTITLLIGSKNGVGGEEKIFKINKDTKVVTALNAATLKLDDLKPDKQVVLRLKLDQEAVQRITVLGE